MFVPCCLSSVSHSKNSKKNGCYLQFRLLSSYSIHFLEIIGRYNSFLTLLHFTCFWKEMNKNCKNVRGIFQRSQPSTFDWPNEIIMEIFWGYLKMFPNSTKIIQKFSNQLQSLIANWDQSIGIMNLETKGLGIFHFDPDTGRICIEAWTRNWLKFIKHG